MAGSCWSVCEQIIAETPLPEPYLRRLAAEPRWHRALAANPALGDEIWYELYRPGVPAAVAERLCWRQDLDEARLRFVLEERAERRKAPLVAAAAMGGQVFDTLAELVDPEVLDPTTASVLCRRPGTPLRWRARVASRAALADALLVVLDDHRTWSDDEVMRILTGPAAATANPIRRLYPIVMAMLLDRPSLAERFAASGVPYMLRAAAYVGVGVKAQQEILTACEAELAAEGGWGHRQHDAAATARLVGRHACATPETALAAGRITNVDGVDDEAPKGIGVHPRDASSHQCDEILGTYDQAEPTTADVWVLAGLSTNPNLSCAQRERLREVLFATKRVSRALGNAAEHMRERLEAQGARHVELVPRSRWRRNATGTLTVLNRRLGPASRPRPPGAGSQCHDEVLIDCCASEPFGWVEADLLGNRLAAELDPKGFEAAMTILAAATEIRVGALVAMARAAS